MRYSPKLLLAFCLLLLPLSLQAKDEKEDPIEQSLLEVFTAYKKDDLPAVKEKLAEILKAIEEKEIAKVGEALPDTVEDWKAADLVREDLAALGGGISVKRTYTLEPKSITVKIVMDSPLIDAGLKFLANRQALKFSKKKVHTVDGEAALVDNERKVLIGVDGKILVELVGDNDTNSRDLIDFARKLGLKKIKQLK